MDGKGEVSGQPQTEGQGDDIPVDKEAEDVVSDVMEGQMGDQDVSEPVNKLQVLLLNFFIKNKIRYYSAYHLLLPVMHVFAVILNIFHDKLVTIQD